MGEGNTIQRVGWLCDAICGIFDFVCVSMVIHAIHTEMNEKFDTLVSGTNYTEGIRNCAGFTPPVQVLRPDNLTAYQVSQGFPVAPDNTGNTTNITANCSGLTHAQQYWGLVFFNPDPSAPLATSKMKDSRYAVFILASINVMSMALPLLGIALIIPPWKGIPEGKGGRVTKGILVHLLGLSVHFGEMYIIALFVCDLRTVGFYCFHLPLAYIIAVNVVPVAVGILFACIKSKELQAMVCGLFFVFFTACVIIPQYGFIYYLYEYFKQIKDANYHCQDAKPTISVPIYGDSPYMGCTLHQLASLGVAAGIFAAFRAASIVVHIFGMAADSGYGRV